MPVELEIAIHKEYNIHYYFSQYNILYMRWFFSFGANALVLSCNNVGHCHFYQRLLTCIPSLEAHDLACPRRRAC